MPKLVIQNWEESEAGWGVRPDGFTIHPNRAQRDNYVAWYNAHFNNTREVPPEYTRTSGEPFEIDVSEDLHERVARATGRVSSKATNTIVNGIHGKGLHFPDHKKTITYKEIEWPEGY